MFRDCLANLYCADLPAALRFYRDLLGFTETFRYPREGPPQHVELRLGGTTIAVSTTDAVIRTRSTCPLIGARPRPAPAGTA